MSTWWDENKRKVYQGIAITMSLTTPVVTVVVTKKALDKVKEKGVKGKKEIAKTVAPYAIIPATMTLVGTGASILAYNEGTKALALASTASSALASLTTSNKIYDEVVKEIAGDTKYKEIAQKYVEKVEKDNPASPTISETLKKRIDNGEVDVKKKDDTLIISLPTADVVETGTGSTMFKERWSNQRFLSDWEFIRSVVNDLNERINSGYDVTVNDLLMRLRIDKAELGDAYYFPNGIKYIADNDHLYTRNDNNQPLGILEFAVGYSPVPVKKPLARI